MHLPTPMSFLRVEIVSYLSLCHPPTEEAPSAGTGDTVASRQELGRA